MRAHISIISINRGEVAWDLKKPEESFAIVERFRDKDDVFPQGDSLMIDKRCETKC